MVTTDDLSLGPVPSLPSKVLITGTGRSGTTLLVQVLTDLGLDTGVTAETPIDQRAGAGLELPVDDPSGPRIVKSPTIIPRLDGLLQHGTIRLEHVIVPIRDLDVATASRVRLTRYGTDLRTWGGLMGTRRADRQREALALLEYELFLTLARHDVPHTLLAFPRFAHDWEYTYRKLAFLDPSVPPDRWRAAIAARVQPAMTHEQTLSRSEQVMTIGGTAYNRFVARPARALKTLVRPNGGAGAMVNDERQEGSTT